MNEQEILNLLGLFSRGEISDKEVVEKIKKIPYEELNFAKIDHHRSLRQGFPEVVFCQGKTIEQVVAIMQHLSAGHTNILATRATEEMYVAVKDMHKDAEYNVLAKTISIVQEKLTIDEERYILVMTAGTSDIPVAEEAATTAEIMGNKVMRCYDVGVAGIHRLFAQKALMDHANVIIVAAGMDGALPSVVGGLTDKPVIAVPTSVGYGANFSGLSALLSMLNSCSAGIGVVNIDNGFGAGRLASIINQMR